MRRFIAGGGDNQHFGPRWPSHCSIGLGRHIHRPANLRQHPPSDKGSHAMVCRRSSSRGGLLLVMTTAARIVVAHRTAPIELTRSSATATTTRRAVSSLLLPAISFGWCSKALPVSAADSVLRAPPIDEFGLYPEGRPFTHYSENAGKLASHLEWFISPKGDPAFRSALESEMAAFAATYMQQSAARQDAAETLPGIAELGAAIDALAQFFASSGSDAAAGGAPPPLPESLVDTVRRNTRATKKLLRRAQAASIWPTCRGKPLGSRDMMCAPE